MEDNHDYIYEIYVDPGYNLKRIESNLLRYFTSIESCRNEIFRILEENDYKIFSIDEITRMAFPVETSIVSRKIIINCQKHGCGKVVDLEFPIYGNLHIEKTEPPLPGDLSKVDRDKLMPIKCDKLCYYNAVMTCPGNEQVMAWYFNDDMAIVNYFARYLANELNTSSKRFSFWIKSSAAFGVEGLIKAVDKATAEEYYISTTKEEETIKDSIVVFGSTLQPMLLERDQSDEVEPPKKIKYQIEISFVPKKSRSMANFAMNQYRIMPHVIAQCVATSDTSIFDFNDRFCFTNLNEMSMAIASNLRDKFKLRTLRDVTVSDDRNIYTFTVDTDNKKFRFAFKFHHANHFGLPL